MLGGEAWVPDRAPALTAEPEDEGDGGAIREADPPLGSLPSHVVPLAGGWGSRRGLF